MHLGSIFFCLQLLSCDQEGFSRFGSHTCEITREKESLLLSTCSGKSCLSPSALSAGGDPGWEEQWSLAGGQGDLLGVGRGTDSPKPQFPHLSSGCVGCVWDGVVERGMVAAHHAFPGQGPPGAVSASSEASAVISLLPPITHREVETKLGVPEVQRCRLFQNVPAQDVTAGGCLCNTRLFCCLSCF